MKVIVCGAGQVGYAIARHLAGEHNDVTVIEQNPALVQRVNDTLDVQGMEGFASHPDVLERAGAPDADMIIAVTYADEVNMVACQVAHSLFNVPTKIARVREQSYLKTIWRDLFSRDHMPIDVIISPEVEVARAVERRLHVPGAFDTIPFADEKVRVIGVSINEDCPILDTPLRQLTELFPDLNVVVVGIIRGDRMIVPSGDDQLLASDDVYFVAEVSHVARALTLFGHEEKEARRIIIIGGGHIGLAVAQRLEEDGAGVRTKLIELNKERAEFAAENLERTVVINGDALDGEIMLEANVRETETVVAVTNDDETNILTSLLAKKYGCGRVVTLVNNTSYAPLIRSLGIDAAVNPRATTVSTILQHVRRGRIRGLHSLRDGMAEVIEVEALETSGLVGTPLRDAKIPTGVIVGAVVRGDEVIIPRGNTVVQVKDRVIMFALADRVREVEKMFTVRIDFF
jgi:trk system potassium uptake protein TrkA